MKKSQQAVILPKKTLRNLLETMHDFAALHDEVEDYLLSTDPDFLKKMRRAKREHKQGKVGSWEELRRKYVPG